jgi:hypothetical protein
VLLYIRWKKQGTAVTHLASCMTDMLTTFCALSDCVIEVAGRKTQGRQERICIIKALKLFA